MLCFQTVRTKIQAAGAARVRGMYMRSFLIGPNDAGQRLDRFVAKAMPSLPFSLVQKGVRTKKIRLDGRRAEAGTPLTAGQTVSVWLRETPSDARTPPPPSAPFDDLDIVFENEHILLLHKKPGLPVHPDETASVHTLINQARTYLRATGQWDPSAEHSFTPALAHRLDRNTGGLVLAAKTAGALRVLNQKFRDREIDKYYMCLVHGHPRPDTGVLRHYLKRDPEAKRVAVRSDCSDGAKTALTAYRVLAARDGLSLVECRLLTGRTHQIRAQWAAVGHPLLGDGKYGAGSRDRRYGFTHQALYAYKLAFTFTTPAGCLEPLRGRCFALPVPFAEDFRSRD